MRRTGQQRHLSIFLFLSPYLLVPSHLACIPMVTIDTVLSLPAYLSYSPSIPLVTADRSLSISVLLCTSSSLSFSHRFPCTSLITRDPSPSLSLILFPCILLVAKVRSVFLSLARCSSSFLFVVLV